MAARFRDLLYQKRSTYTCFEEHFQYRIRSFRNPTAAGIHPVTGTGSGAGVPPGTPSRIWEATPSRHLEQRLFPKSKASTRLFADALRTSSAQRGDAVEVSQDEFLYIQNLTSDCDFPPAAPGRNNGGRTHVPARHSAAPRQLQAGSTFERASPSGCVTQPLPCGQTGLCSMSPEPIDARTGRSTAGMSGRLLGRVLTHTNAGHMSAHVRHFNFQYTIACAMPASRMT